MPCDLLTRWIWIYNNMHTVRCDRTLRTGEESSHLGPLLLVIREASCLAGSSGAVFVSWLCGFIVDEDLLDGLILGADGVWEHPFPHTAILIYNPADCSHYTIFSRLLCRLWLHEFQSVSRSPNKAHGDVQRWEKVGKKHSQRSKEGNFKPRVRDVLHN